MLEIIKAGGWLMAPIILCSILALTIIAERFWALRRSRVVPVGVGKQVEDWAARHELDRRHIEQLRSGSALGRILSAGLVNRHLPIPRMFSLTWATGLISTPESWQYGRRSPPQSISLTKFCSMAPWR